MKKQLLGTFLAAALPLAALAQGGPPAQGNGKDTPRYSVEKMEKRMRLARTLGLAEALDLDAPAALKLGETIAKFDERRIAAHKSAHEARDVLRRAAQGEKVSAAEVDQAIQKGLDARAQLTAIDRETVAAVTQGLSPEKKARAVLFLAKFQRRFQGHGGPGMGPGGAGMRPGMMGPGMGPGRRGGPGGPGHDEWGAIGGGERGPMMGLAQSPPPTAGDFDDEPED